MKIFTIQNTKTKKYIKYSYKEFVLKYVDNYSFFMFDEYEYVLKHIANNFDTNIRELIEYSEIKIYDCLDPKIIKTSTYVDEYINSKGKNTFNKYKNMTKLALLSEYRKCSNYKVSVKRAIIRMLLNGDV
jgi:hypothetical protein